MSQTARKALAGIKDYCRKHSAEKYKAKKSAPKAESPKQMLKDALAEGETKAHEETEDEDYESYEDELPSVVVSVGSAKAPPKSSKMPVKKK